MLPDRAGIDTLYVVVKAGMAVAASQAVVGGRAGPRGARRPNTTATQPPRACAPRPSCTSGSRAPTSCSSAVPGLLGGLRGATDAGVGLGDRKPRRRCWWTGDRTGATRRQAIQNPQPVRVDAAGLRDGASAGARPQQSSFSAKSETRIGIGFAGGRSARDAGAASAEHRGSRHAAPTAWRFARAGVPGADCRVVAAAARFAGTYDAAWQSGQSPYLPDDFDPRFFQCAAPEFTFDRYLTGGEPVQLAGVLPDGPIQFAVPDGWIAVSVTIAGAEQQPPAHLETLVIEPDKNRATLTWRASQPCDGVCSPWKRSSSAGGAREHVSSRASPAAMCSAPSATAPGRCGRLRVRASPDREFPRDGSALRSDQMGLSRKMPLGCSPGRSTHCRSRPTRAGCFDSRRQR